MKTKLLYLFLMIFMTMQVFAQSKPAPTSTGGYSIKGVVIDSLSNESVPYATLRIALASAPTQPVKLLACDENGKFSSSMSKPGKYIMTLESLGKTTEVKHFTLSETKKNIDFGKLFMNDDTQHLSEVTVTAQKPLVKVEVDKLTYSLEDDPESKTSNALDMFRKVPLLTVDGEDNIQLKGSSNYKIYMNGKPSNLLSSQNASDVLKSMPASSIKNIEVITDPGSKYDAEGVGGIINIITTKNSIDGFTGTVRANAGTLGRMGVGGYISMKTGKFGLTANYGYNYNNSPWNDSESERTTDNDVLTGSKSLLKENGRNKHKGPFQYGNLEGSFEIDTLNLITVGANLFNGNMRNISELNSNLYPYNSDGTSLKSDPFYHFNRYTNNKSTFGSTDANIDYQHSTHRKDELLTLSYRFSNSPNNSDGKTELENVYNYYLSSQYPRWNKNDASTVEQTAQVDYTRPIFKDQTLEAGVKYINRVSKSNTTELVQDSTGVWQDQSRDNSDFRHTQHIYSAYLGYLLKLGKFGLKAGVRAEGTSLKAKFKKVPDMDFSTDYFDVVPNGTLTYQMDMSSQLRIGYNMRIQRPSIWYLNPYIDNVNPLNISQGNPNLDSEKSNNVNINYSKFTQKFSVNASVSYSFINNSIEQYSFIADFPESDARSEYNGAIWNTYGNIGKKHQLGFFIYGNWTPTTWFRIFTNAGTNYTDIKSTSMDIHRTGWNSRIFAGLQFTLPKDFRINLHGGYFQSQIQLQSKNGNFYFTGINVSKDFLKKKLTIGLRANNPFWNTIDFKNTTKGDGFNYASTTHMKNRDFSISISYRFGQMKGQIKKVRRGISNDDAKEGGSNSQGGESEQTM